LTAGQYQQARRIAEHLDACPACQRALADYQAIQETLGSGETAEPEGGWSAFEGRLMRTAHAPVIRRWRWNWAVAAGLLLALTISNAALWLKSSHGEPRVSANLPNNSAAEFPSDMTDATVAKAFSTLSDAYEGKTDWVMLSNESSELGLAADRTSGKDLLILRLVVSRGGKEVSQVHLAIVPGATARVTVPSRTGQQLQYVVATDAQNPQRVALSMALEGTGKEVGKETGLGSMATSITIPFGQSARTGQIATRDGVFDLSMSLQHAQVRETGDGA
jgi:hypothetical protein